LEILKYQFLNDGGAVGALMRSLDWSDSALGDPASWPISLHVLTRHMLASSFPMFITWARDSASSTMTPTPAFHSARKITQAVTSSIVALID